MSMYTATPRPAMVIISMPPYQAVRRTRMLAGAMIQPRRT